MRCWIGDALMWRRSGDGAWQSRYVKGWGVMAPAKGQHGQSSVLDHERVEQYQEERRYLVTVPVARYYALLVGLALLPLGVLGFIPQFARGGVLFGLLRVTPTISVLYILTGVAGISAFALKRGHYAHDFALILTGVYLLIFSSGNIAFGNAEGSAGGAPNIPWILENALHAGLMLTGALITGLAALQRGDRATARVFKRRYGVSDRRADAAAGKTAGSGAMMQRWAAGGSRHALHDVLDHARHAVALLSLTLLVMLLASIVRRSWQRMRMVSAGAATTAAAHRRETPAGPVAG